MNTKVKIQNFRVFDQKGTEAEIKPLTILTGCNSSGKSSIVKALMCLNEFKNSNAIRFDKEPLSLLGNFDSILNRDEKELNNGCFTISYSFDSNYFGRDCIIEYSFVAEESARRDGVLSTIKIQTADGDVLYSEEEGDKFLHYSYDAKLIDNRKRAFWAYLLCSEILSDGCVVTSAEEAGIPRDEVEKILNHTKNSIKEMLDEFGYDLVARAVTLWTENRRPNVDANLVKASLKANILTYLPVLERIDSFPPFEFGDRFRDLFKNGNSIDLIEKVLSDYLNSGENSFSDYYRVKERAFIASGLSLSFDEFIYDFGLRHMREVPKDSVDCRTIFDLLTGIDYPENSSMVERFLDGPNGDFERKDHKMLVAYGKWFFAGLSEIKNSNPCNNLRYVSSNRVDIKRSYTPDRDSEFGRLISDYFDALNQLRNKEKGKQKDQKYNSSIGVVDLLVDEEVSHYESGSFVNKWLQKFDVGDHLAIESIGHGLGLIINIYATPKDQEGRLLADFGYGISQLISILLEIETMLLRKTSSDDLSLIRPISPIDYKTKTIKLSKVFHEDYSPAFPPSTIAVEEPEIHLHPRYQSLLAEMFYEAHQKYNISFIIETHSEYLIRRLQTLVGAKELLPEEVSIIYVEDNESVKNGMQKVRRINIKEDGCLEEPFSPGFFDVADSLAMKLLMIKGGLE